MFKAIAEIIWTTRVPIKVVTNIARMGTCHTRCLKTAAIAMIIKKPKTGIKNGTAETTPTNKPPMIAQNHAVFTRFCNAHEITASIIKSALPCSSVILERITVCNIKREPRIGIEIQIDIITKWKETYSLNLTAIKPSTHKKRSGSFLFRHKGGNINRSEIGDN